MGAMNQPPTAPIILCWLVPSRLSVRCLHPNSPAFPEALVSVHTAPTKGP